MRLTSPSTLCRAAALLGALCVLTPAITVAAAHVVSQSLAVTGAVKKSLVLTVEDLKAFPANELGSFVLTRRVDNKDTSSALKGVRLTAVLDRAALIDGDHNRWKHSLVVATATDGYQVVFSWPRLCENPVAAVQLGG